LPQTANVPASLEVPGEDHSALLPVLAAGAFLLVFALAYMVFSTGPTQQANSGTPLPIRPMTKEEAQQYRGVIDPEKERGKEYTASDEELKQMYDFWKGKKPEPERRYQPTDVQGPLADLAHADASIVRLTSPIKPRLAASANRWSSAWSGKRVPPDGSHLKMPTRR
jgi:hypothetical protein